MVADIPEIAENRAYSIAETCKLLGVHRNTLRRYTCNGMIKAMTRKADGRTLYSGGEIVKLVRTTI